MSQTSPNHPPSIAVIGAGTMGAGIAQVALQAGSRVWLYDVAGPMLQRARDGMEQRLMRQVDKGKLATEQVQSMMQALSTTQSLSDLADADVVIEAVPERIELKRDLFRQLDQVCRPDAILASNTSSLSITVLAASTNNPSRVVGMHFFNPAPVMKLVEVIRGEDTDDQVVDRIVQLAGELGKQPIVCQDTPGFIVNRVARNFYGEALRIVWEGTASIDAVDALMVDGAGFRMGPFRLMDLIGIDVNYDVTQAVYQAYHGEPRYRPHPLQARQVESGRLGQKTGRGFYRYDETPAGSQASFAEPGKETADGLPVKEVKLAVVGNTTLVDRIAQRLPHSNEDRVLRIDTSSSSWNALALRWRCDEVEAFLRKHRPDVVFFAVAADKSVSRKLLQSVEHAVGKETVILTSLAGPGATEQASWLTSPERIRGFGWLGQGSLAEWTVPLQAEVEANPRYDEKGQNALRALGLNTLRVRDGAGGVVNRILSMIFNEAIEVLREGTATPQDIDLAMRYGTSYPRGPIEWMDEIGLLPVLSTLEALSSELGDDRYRASALLKRRIDAGWTGGYRGPAATSV